MRKLLVALILLFGLFLDSVLFHQVNLSGARPDAVLAMMASLGVLMGGVRGGVLGAAVGLVADILYSGQLGLSAIGYMAAGALGGLFYQKYYADNIVIPALVAVAGAFFKENVMAVAAWLSGAEFSYFRVLASCILPCMLLTGAFCMPVHAVLKKLFAGQVRGEHASPRDRAHSGHIGGVR